MEFFLAILIIFGWLHLDARIRKLENQLKSNEKTPLEKVKQINKFEEIEEPAIEQDSILDPILNWLKTDWLMKLGALLLILAFSWLVRYAFIENWIEPIDRIILGLVSGILVMVLGEWRSRIFRNQGSVFMTLGAGLIIISVYAARNIYDFFTPLTGLLIVLAAVIFMAVSSVRHKNLPIAVLGLLIGAVTPLLVNSGSGNFTSLFSYLFILCAGMTWVVALTGWRIIPALAMIIFSLYSLPFLELGSLKPDDEFAAMIFAFIFAALFYAGNLGGIINRKNAAYADLFTAGLNGIMLLLWISEVVPEQFQSLASLMAALLFITGAGSIYKITKLEHPVYVYAGVAVVLVGGALSFELENQALTIAYTLEAALVAFGASYFSKNPGLGQRASLAMLIPAGLSIESFSDFSLAKEVLTADFFVLLILAITFLGLGTYFYLICKDRMHHQLNKFATAILFIFSGFYSASLIWLSLEIALTKIDSAHTIALIIYILIGIPLYLIGKNKNQSGFTWAGTIIVSLVTIRLLMVEVWQMGLTGRIITFALIGVLLISTAFIGRRKEF